MNWIISMIAVLAGIALLILGEIYRESKGFVTRVYHILIPEAALKHTHNIVFISDLHNHLYGDENQILLDAIREQNPEFVLVGGDVMVAREKAPLDVAIQFIKNLSREYQVYYSSGNHEQRLGLYPEKYGNMYQEYMQAIQDGKLVYLINDSRRVMLEDFPIDITGLEIDKEFYKRFSHKMLQKQDMVRLLGEKKNVYTILLAHNPEYFKAYATWGADLTLSGHVHGGVVRLPFLGGVISPSFRIFPKYDGGRKKEFGKEMIISRGLGVHTIPVRLFNPAELVVLKIHS